MLTKYLCIIANPNQLCLHWLVTRTSNIKTNVFIYYPPLSISPCYHHLILFTIRLYVILMITRERVVVGGNGVGLNQHGPGRCLLLTSHWLLTSNNHPLMWSALHTSIFTLTLLTARLVTYCFLSHHVSLCRPLIVACDIIFVIVHSHSVSFCHQIQAWKFSGELHGSGPVPFICHD